MIYLLIALPCVLAVAIGVWFALRLRPHSEGDADDVPHAPAVVATTAWEDIQAKLPQGWARLSTVPARHAGTLVPVDSPYVEGLVRGLANVAPTWAASSGEHLFRMIGPPSALDGLASGQLDWVYDKAGRQLMTLRGPGGEFVSNARVVNITGSAQAATAAACVFQVLSVVTAQYYLHGINTALSKISEQAAAILGKLNDQRWGKYLAAADVVMEVERDVLGRMGKGTLPQHLDASIEFWTRMASVETALREVIAECELDYTRRRDSAVSVLCKQQSTGEWVRRPTAQRDEIKQWDETREWQQSVGTLHLAGVRMMVLWYQVVLTHDTIVSSSRIRERYTSLMDFVAARADFLNGVGRDGDMILAQEGTTFADGAKDIASAFLEGFTYGLLRPARTTEDAHLAAGRALAESYTQTLSAAKPVLEFARAPAHPSTFYIESCEGKLDILVAKPPSVQSE